MADLKMRSTNVQDITLRLLIDFKLWMALYMADLDKIRSLIKSIARIRLLCTRAEMNIYFGIDRIYLKTLLALKESR